MSDGWKLDFNCRIGSAANTASKNKSIVNGLRYHRRIYKLLHQHVALSVPDQKLYVEPWLRHPEKGMRQPDAVLVDEISQTGIVIEVKMNWKDGRDETLINVYLDAVKEAFNLEMTWPALITSNVRGLPRENRPRLGLSQLLGCAEWEPGDHTPVILVP